MWPGCASSSASKAVIWQTQSILCKKLDLKLHELDETLRPKLEQPVKEKPLLSVALSAGAGALIGALGVMALVAGGRSQD